MKKQELEIVPEQVKDNGKGHLDSLDIHPLIVDSLITS